jgi:uncharacterized ubiquitin-like protein YukD
VIGDIEHYCGKVPDNRVAAHETLGRLIAFLRRVNKWSNTFKKSIPKTRHKDFGI